MIAPWDKALWRDVLAGLKLRPGRTLLAAGAIALGACALTVLLAAVAGLQAHTLAITRVLGSHTFAVLGAAPGGVARERLQLGDVGLLSANLQGARVSAVRRDSVAVPGHELTLDMLSTDENLAAVRGWQLVDGRFLDAGDLAYAERNLVATQALARQWGWHVGQVVDVRDVPFKVVGIVDTPAAALEATALAPDIVVRDLSAFVPESVAPDWVGGNDKVAPWGVDAIYVRAGDDEALSKAQHTAAELLTPADGGVSHLSWVTPSTLAAGLDQLRHLVAAVAGGVSFLSLILGAITLISLMLANVQDRVAEIGLRRSFGAEPSDVALLFVAESLGLTLAAALAGALLAVVILQLGPRLPLPVQLDSWVFLGPLLMGATLGIVAAWWPARMAARIEPAQALRQT
ncbi:MAG TPA: ABC transporter permease [Gammaproteobacteria bacterium]